MGASDVRCREVSIFACVVRGTSWLVLVVCRVANFAVRESIPETSRHRPCSFGADSADIYFVLSKYPPRSHVASISMYRTAEPISRNNLSKSNDCPRLVPRLPPLHHPPFSFFTPRAPPPSLASLGPGVALHHIFPLLVRSVLRLPRLAFVAELVHFARTNRAEFWHFFSREARRGAMMYEQPRESGAMW